MVDKIPDLFPHNEENPFDADVVEGEVQAIKARLEGQKGRKTSQASSSIRPGDIMSFGYVNNDGKTGNHLVLVLASKRAPNGVFVGKNGKYRTAVRLDGLSDVIMSIILEFLYKNVKASYSKVVKKGLFALVGKPRFRTYIMNKMSIVEVV